MPALLGLCAWFLPYAQGSSLAMTASVGITTVAKAPMGVTAADVTVGITAMPVVTISAVPVTGIPSAAIDPDTAVIRRIDGGGADDRRNNWPSHYGHGHRQWRQRKADSEAEPNTGIR